MDLAGRTLYHALGVVSVISPVISGSLPTEHLLPCQARAEDPAQLAPEAHSYMRIRDCADRRKQACSEPAFGRRLCSACVVHDQSLTLSH
jgi:hypothetical protein